jgi:hypothetical protein
VIFLIGITATSYSSFIRYGNVWKGQDLVTAIRKPDVIDNLKAFAETGLTLEVANDRMPEAIETFLFNHPDAWAEAEDIEEIDPAQVRRRLGFKKGSLDVLVGALRARAFRFMAYHRLEAHFPRWLYSQLGVQFASCADSIVKELASPDFRTIEEHLETDSRAFMEDS